MFNCLDVTRMNISAFEICFWPNSRFFWWTVLFFAYTGCYSQVKQSHMYDKFHYVSLSWYIFVLLCLIDLLMKPINWLCCQKQKWFIKNSVFICQKSFVFSQSVIFFEDYSHCVTVFGHMYTCFQVSLCLFFKSCPVSPVTTRLSSCSIK